MVCKIPENVSVGSWNCSEQSPEPPRLTYAASLAPIRHLSCDTHSINPWPFLASWNQSTPSEPTCLKTHPSLRSSENVTTGKELQSNLILYLKEWSTENQGCTGAAGEDEEPSAQAGQFQYIHSLCWSSGLKDTCIVCVCAQLVCVCSVSVCVCSVCVRAQLVCVCAQLVWVLS